jgi:hypothetical protein
MEIMEAFALATLEVPVQTASGPTTERAAPSTSAIVAIRPHHHHPLSNAGVRDFLPYLGLVRTSSSSREAQAVVGILAAPAQGLYWLRVNAVLPSLGSTMIVSASTLINCTLHVYLRYKPAWQSIF